MGRGDEAGEVYRSDGFYDRMHPFLMARKTPVRAKKRPNLKQMRPVILRIAGGYGVTNVRIFGSFARGDQRGISDVDLLVDLPDDMSLLDLSGLKIDLEEAVRRKVDVVPARSIKPTLEKYILDDARPL